tara:strand:- start:93 stop:497 length:405 start_codon:yes stop_codon:yes gene_type:complete
VGTREVKQGQSLNEMLIGVQVAGAQAVAHVIKVVLQEEHRQEQCPVEGKSVEDRQHVQFLLNQVVLRAVRVVVMEKAVMEVVVMWGHAVHIVINVIIHALMRSVKAQLERVVLKIQIVVQIVVREHVRVYRLAA